MKYLLDTNICIYALNEPSKPLGHRLHTHEASELALSALTVAELRYGASFSARPDRNHRQLDDFFPPFTILSWHEDSAKIYGELMANLRRKGTPIGVIDGLIASQALLHKLTVVTNNLKEFQRVPGLVCENWL